MLLVLRPNLLPILLVVGWLVGPAAAQAPNADVPATVLDWIRAHAIPLSGADPALSDADLDALAPVFGDARVVGLGEGTHGTREFFQFRDRVVRWIARRGELGAVLWETGFVRSLGLEPALNDPAVPIADVGLLGGLWGTDENEALLASLRAHNAQTARPVRFIGVDAFDLALSTVAALAAAPSAGGDAAQAVAVMADALGRDPGATCADERACYGAFFAMTEAETRRFAEGAAWLADVLAASESAGWTGAVAARSLEHRARHLLQFSRLAPRSADADAAVSTDEDTYAAVQTAARVAADTLAAALAARDPAYWASVAPVAAAVPDGAAAYRDSLGVADRYAWDEAVRGLRARVATGRYGDPAGDASPLVAAADALVGFVDRLHESLRVPPDHMSFDNYREVALGATVAAVVAQTDGRAVFAAHNLHVGYNASPTLARRPSGTFVRDALGDDYLAVGTLFGQGRFQAADQRAGEGWDGPRVRAFESGPPPAGSFEAAMMAVGLDAFALDLRAVPAEGPVAAWFRTPRPTRDVGNSYDPDRPEAFVYEAVVADGYDVVVFFRETTRAVPTAAALARGGYDLSPN